MGIYNPYMGVTPLSMRGQYPPFLIKNKVAGNFECYFPSIPGLRQDKLFLRRRESTCRDLLFWQENGSCLRRSDATLLLVFTTSPLPKIETTIVFG